MLIAALEWLSSDLQVCRCAVRTCVVLCEASTGAQVIVSENLVKEILVDKNLLSFGISTVYLLVMF